MRFIKRASIFAIAASATAVLTATAFAQTVGIGTTKGGATAQVTAGLSKVVSANAGGLQMRPQPMGGTQQYIPVVNAGELEFGVSNAMQAYMAFTGISLSEGKKNDNLRLVATLMTFRTGMFVKNSSDIKSISDLKGKRVPGEFTASPLFNVLAGAWLANADMKWTDVNVVPQTSLPKHWQQFEEGKLDAAYGAIGSGVMKRINAKVGGIRFLSLATDEESVKRMLSVAPRTYTKEVKPAPPLIGVITPVQALHFNYVLWANKDVPDDVVTRVVKAIYENEAGLKGASPLWRSHSSARMGTQYGPEMPLHPAAAAFYKSVGILK